jgi:phosphoglycolate phosphatase-like HAD superfamily hydrolase
VSATGVEDPARWRAVLFDLDGTLTDPKLGITRSIQYALRKRGIAPPEADDLEVFIGPPLEQSFRESLPDASDARRRRDYEHRAGSRNEVRRHSSLCATCATGRRVVSRLQSTVFAERTSST